MIAVFFQFSVLVSFYINTLFFFLELGERGQGAGLNLYQIVQQSLGNYFQYYFYSFRRTSEVHLEQLQFQFYSGPIKIALSSGFI